VTLGNMVVGVDVDVSLRTPFHNCWLLVRGRHDKMLQSNDVTAHGNYTIRATLLGMRRRWRLVGPIDEYSCAYRKIANG